MELGGLVLVALVGAMLIYAVPNRAARKHAVANSREGDRFSQSLALVEAPTDHSELLTVEVRGATSGTRLPSPSTGPILIRYEDREQGSKMTDAPKAEANQQTDANPGVVRTHPAREYAALRARRAARRSAEAAAARRRVVTVAVAAVLIVALTALAAAQLLSWWWVAVPSVFLVGSVAGSVISAQKSRQQDEAETERLAELKRELSTIRARQSGKPSGQARLYAVKSEADRETPSAPKVSARTNAETEVPFAEPARAQVVPNEDGATAETADVVETELELEAVAGTELADDEPPALEAAVERSWTVTPVPPPMHTLRPKVVGRQVRPDTDIVQVVSEPEAAVPARPKAKTSKSQPTATTAPSMTGPTFKFDLDAVLENRRAQ